MEAEYVRPRRRWPVVLVCLGAVALGIFGAAAGASGATHDAAQQAQSLRASGDFGRAVAVEDALAARTAPIFLLDRSDVEAAPRLSQSTLLTWAAALAHRGRADQAAVLLASVTDPGLIGSAAGEHATLLLEAAEQAAKSGDYGSALLRLDQVSALHPAQAIAAQVAQLMPQYQVGAAAALTSAGRGADAVGLLDSAAAASASVHGAVAAALPAALLAAGNEELAMLSYKEAAATLGRLVSDFPGSPQARTARSLLRKGQPVTGTLVEKSGHPVTAQVRLSSHFFSTPGGYYTTGPFYYTSSDSQGTFAFASIPQGGPYTLEVFRNGGWTTFVDPNTGQPAMPVNVTPLVPVDLAFVALS